MAELGGRVVEASRTGRQGRVVVIDAAGRGGDGQARVELRRRLALWRTRRHAMRLAASLSDCNRNWSLVGWLPLRLLRLAAVVEQVGEEAVERPELVRVVLGHRQPGQAHETYHDSCRSNSSFEHGVTHPSSACCP